MVNSSRNIGVPLSTGPTYEAGAALFSYLAFPDEDAEPRRADVHAALCHLALRAIGAEDQNWLWTPSSIKPGYALMREAAVQRAVTPMDRRLVDRLKAALMAKPLLEEVAIPSYSPKAGLIPLER